MKILVVEDDKTVGQYVKRGLVEAGYHTDLVGEGDDGLRLASGGHYELLVLDLRLPRMSGLEVLRTLRDRGNSIPVLVLRGAQSDLVLKETTDEMMLRGPGPLGLTRIVEVPGTHGMTLSGTLRMLSGLPFSLIDSSSDPDRNGILQDPLPAGTYSGKVVIWDLD